MFNKWCFANFIFVLTIFASCSKKDQSVPGTTPVTPEITNPLGITVSSEFNYETISATSLDITLLTNGNEPLAGVMVNIFDRPSDEGGAVLFTSVSDANGKISGSISLPAYLKTVIVDPGYIGIMHNAIVSVSSKNIFCTLGGTSGYSGNVIPNGRTFGSVNQELSIGRTIADTYKYMGKYNTSGKPDYLLPVNDKISTKLLSYINASLPENKSAPVLHPEYLKDNTKTNLDIVNSCTVWITFVHEGASYQNSLAYFTYPTKEPPKSASQIESLIVILPNASISGSGGALNSGNKVSLGEFKPGTSIGFCVIANGWSDKTQVVGAGLNKFYTIDALNPETKDGLKRHALMLKNDEDQLILTGFEDQRRDQSSDNDFNDLIFYATSSVESSISTVDMNSIDKPNDTDNDGVLNINDVFPTDPLRAYINYYPGMNTYGTIAFEDTWPNTGDYDMNDLVVDYRYASVLNAKNRTVEMYANYACRASGAVFRNGFGVGFSFSPAAVESVTGSRVTGSSVVTLNSNGCEAGQAKAVIIPFDDIYAIMKSSGTYLINTQPGAPFIVPDTVRMKVTFKEPMIAELFGLAPFNQFLISNQTRGKEVHLPGELPTDKATVSLFNSVQDNTIPAQKRYYKTKSNLPFAISFPERLQYPYEGKMINTAYLKFGKWAESGGLANPDWYKDSTGYRTKEYLYK